MTEYAERGEETARLEKIAEGLARVDALPATATAIDMWAHYARSWSSDLRWLLSLRSARPEGEDARRLDALQRWAEESVDDHVEIVSLNLGCEWTVIGPEVSPGVRSLGQGAWLRDAIDDALNDERELQAARATSTPTRSERE